MWRNTEVRKLTSQERDKEMGKSITKTGKEQVRVRTLGGEGVCRTPHNSEGLDRAARREPQPFSADGEFLFKPRQERAQTPAHCSWRVEFPPNKYQALGWNSLSVVHCPPAPPLLPPPPSRPHQEPRVSRLVGLGDCELCPSPGPRTPVT